MQSQIAEDVKMAREYALLGTYDTSVVYYESAVSNLQKLADRAEAAMKPKWLDVSIAAVWRGCMCADDRGRVYDSPCIAV